MRKLLILAVVAAAPLGGCTTRHIADPRFEFPAPPVDMSKPLGSLQPLSNTKPSK